MGDIDKGDSQFIFQANQFVLHLLPQLQIQRAERFIEEQHSRFIHDGTGNRNSLLLPAGERIHGTFLIALQIHEFQGVLNFVPDVFFRLLPDTESKGNIVRNIHVRKQSILLKNRIELPFVCRKIRDILPFKKDTSLIRLLKSSNNSKCSRFSAARRPEQSHETVLPYRKRKIVQNKLSVK